MKLPYDLLSGTYTAPRFFLCETDKTKICQLKVGAPKGQFKFNGLSEISFEIDRTYNSFYDGVTKVNPYYDKVEALRLLFVEGFGYFEIQGPKLSSDGINEHKEVTAYSLEYTLAQKYITNLVVNTGAYESIEVEIARRKGTGIVPVTLYNEEVKELSLLHIILEKAYGWTIGHVDPQIATLGRTFEIDRISIYDFIMNEICDKFNCIVTFDTINNTINFYAESQVAKFIGDGETKTFVISPPFKDINTVSVDGYKTTQYEYKEVTYAEYLDPSSTDAKTGLSTVGLLTFTGEAPAKKSHIEVVDGSMTRWETDVYISFNNLSDNINVSYDADNIKTVLDVTYGDDSNIREINLGSSSITDLSYYHTVDWMGQSLYNAYSNYLIKCNNLRRAFIDNSKKLQDVAGMLNFCKKRLTLGYSMASVVPTTVGEDYYVRGGSSPRYYYTQVSLPKDYNANLQYYRMNGSNLNEELVSDFYTMLKKYFVSEIYTDAKTAPGEFVDLNWSKDLDDMTPRFAFVAEEYKEMKDYLQLYPKQINRTVNIMVRHHILKFLNAMWYELGYVPLKSFYYDSYKQVQSTNTTAGYAEITSENYLLYFPVTLMLDSLESAMTQRQQEIDAYQSEYNRLIDIRTEMALDTKIEANFTEEQMLRLSSFLREDQLKVEDVIETDTDTIAQTFTNQQHAMETARIELSKISQPKLQFSMGMGNIYALKEFEPMVKQFQLGNVIKVALRPGYLKQSRLLGVNINFEDMNDFSCDFGDLTNIKTQSDIHADLLAGAITAGKTVATNSSHWTQGSDTADKLNLDLQKGLLDTVEALKSSEGQNCYIDKRGIHLESSEESNPKKIWMVNDKIVFTDDNFKTAKAVIGEYIHNGQSKYGVMADYIDAGYIRGSDMEGGTIRIGDTGQVDDNGNKIYAFEVDPDGSVRMNGGTNNYVTTDNVSNIVKQESAVTVGMSAPENPADGQTWLDISITPPILKVYSKETLLWTPCIEIDGAKVFTSKPMSYTVGSLWVINDDDSVEMQYPAGTILKATQTSNMFQKEHWVDSDANGTELKRNMEQYFNFDKDNGLKIGQRDEKFFVQIDSQEMGFYETDNDGNKNKVVSIGNSSAKIRNLEVVNGTNFTCNTHASFAEEIRLFGGTIKNSDNTEKKLPQFVFSQENDGSISLALSI